MANKIKMGLSSGLTAYFTISGKLALSMVFGVDNICHTVKEWIDADPLLVLKWMMSGKIQLIDVAHAYLMNKLKISNPEEYIRYYNKKRQIQARKNILKKINQ